MLKYRVALIIILCFGMKGGWTQTGTICLTYDDGLPSHLQTVIPQLDSFGIKGTFFLNSIQGASDHIGESSPWVTGWRKAAANGHELANHTLFHPCPEKFGWSQEAAIDRYDTSRLFAEIRTQASLLDAIDPSHTARTFAYPCNNTIVAGIDYAVLLQEKKLFEFARAGGDSTSVIVDRKKLDPMKVPGWMVEEGTTLQQLIAFAEKAKAANGIAIYQFHGIGAEFFRISAETHRLFLSYLRSQPEAFKIVTFSSAMRDR
jgi:hypothetical protein